jgi:ParB/RepB/Spo0J family partition protein
MNKPNRFVSAMSKTSGSGDFAPDQAELDKFVAGAAVGALTAEPQRKTHVPQQASQSSGTFLISHDLLISNPYDARQYRGQDKHQEMRAMLASDGQKHAIQITRANKDGKHIVIDGHRRWLGNDANGVKQSKAEINWDIDPDDSLQLYWLSYSLNMSNEPHRDYDNGLMWGRLIAEGKTTLEEVATKAGKAKSTVSQMICYYKLSPETLSIIEQDPDKFPYSIAYQIYRLVANDKLAEAFKLTKAYSEAPTGLRAVQSKVEAILSDATKTRQRKGSITRAEFGLRGGGTGRIVAFDDGTLEVHFESLDRETQELLQQKIQAVLDSEIEQDN